MEEQKKQVEQYSTFCKLLLIGIMYRLTQIFALTGDSRLEIICLPAFADAEQDLGRYNQAADHYRQLLRKLPPFHADGKAEREYAMSLALAGNTDEAIAYSEQRLSDAKKTVSALRTEQSLLLLAHSSHTTGLIHELVGNGKRANEVRHDLYEMVRALPSNSKAHHIGLLCAAEALAQESQHEQAIPLLEQFVELAAKCYPTIDCSYTLMGIGYKNLAVSLAQTGKREEAQKTAIAAKLQFNKDGGSLAKVSKLSMNAELAGSQPILLKTLQGKGNTKEVFAPHQAADPTNSLEPAKGSLEALKLRGRAGRYSKISRLFIVGGVITPFFLTHSSLWQAPAIGLTLLITIQATLAYKRHVALCKARAAIASAKTLEVLGHVVFEGFALKDTDGKDLGTFYGSEILHDAISTLADDSEFKAVAYVDEFDAIKAIDLFGYFTSLSKSP